jgi:hypothetical protein
MKLEWTDVILHGIPKLAARLGNLLFVIHWNGEHNFTGQAYAGFPGWEFNRHMDTGRLETLGVFDFKCPPIDIAQGAERAIREFVRDQAAMHREKAARLEFLL